MCVLGTGLALIKYIILQNLLRWKSLPWVATAICSLDAKGNSLHCSLSKVLSRPLLTRTSDIFLFLKANKLACHGFINTHRIPENPMLETKDFTTHGAAGSLESCSPWFLCQQVSLGRYRVPQAEVAYTEA